MDGWINEWMIPEQIAFDQAIEMKIVVFQWINEWMNEWMNSYMNEWTRQWMKEWVKINSVGCLHDRKSLNYLE